MWRSDVTDPIDFDDADDDEVLKPSNRASNQQDTGHDSLQNEKEREERIVGDENILRGRRRTKIKHHLVVQMQRFWQILIPIHFDRLH